MTRQSFTAFAKILFATTTLQCLLMGMGASMGQSCVVASFGAVLAPLYLPAVRAVYAQAFSR